MTVPSDLTTPTAVKQWLGITSTADDVLLSGLVSAVSQAILADLGRGALLPAIYVETYDGDGCEALCLRQWPVTQIVSVGFGGVALAAAAPSGGAGYRLDPADVMPPGAPQRIMCQGGTFPRGRQNVVVTYRAGYEVFGEPASVSTAAPFLATAAAPFGTWRIDTGIVGAAGPRAVSDGVYTFTAIDAGKPVQLNYGYMPNDLVQAATEWAADRYAARTRIGQSAKTLGGQETTSFIVKSMPDVVDRLLQPYRRVAR